MISLAFFKRGFTLSWRMGLIVLIFVAILVYLGFWQLQRADEKKQMLLSYHHLSKKIPIFMALNRQLPKQYQIVKVQGTFLSQVMLLDNQHYQHQFGYHVISPLMLEDGQVILVDRGWLAGDVTRRVLPIIKTSSGFVSLLGQVYYPSLNRWQSGPLIERQQHHLIVIERLDIKLISHFLHKPVYPFIIHLDKQEEGGYVRDWSVVSMPPERHYAYALQWFGFALIVFVVFMVWIFKKKS